MAKNMPKQKGPWKSTMYRQIPDRFNFALSSWVLLALIYDVLSPYAQTFFLYFFKSTIYIPVTTSSGLFQDRYTGFATLL